MSESKERITRNGKEYLAWGYAGGPNECAHGYAAGIPCPDCDEAKLPHPEPPPQEREIIGYTRASDEGGFAERPIYAEPPSPAVTESCGNVFADLGLPDAEELQAQAKAKYSPAGEIASEFSDTEQAAMERAFGVEDVKSVPEPVPAEGAAKPVASLDTYGDLVREFPMVAEGIEPHEWDNMNRSEQTRWALNKMDKFAGLLAEEVVRERRTPEAAPESIVVTRGPKVIPAEDGADYFTSPRSASPIAPAAQDWQEERLKFERWYAENRMQLYIHLDTRLRCAIEDTARESWMQGKQSAESYRKESEAK